jgi:hypothetical protein
MERKPEPCLCGAGLSLVFEETDEDGQENVKTISCANCGYSVCVYWRQTWGEAIQKWNEAMNVKEI